MHEFPVAPFKVIEAAKADPADSISKAKAITTFLVLINFKFILASQLMKLVAVLFSTKKNYISTLQQKILFKTNYTCSI